MREPGSIFQEISIRRRVVITVALFTVLIIAVGVFSLIAIVETNKRLHQSVLEGQRMASAVDTARLSQVHYKKQVQEWKNMLLRGQDKASFDKHLSAFNEEDRKVSEYLKSLSQITSSAGLPVSEITGIIQKHEELGRRYREALTKYRHTDFHSAMAVDQSILGIDRNLTNEIDAIVDHIKDLAQKRLNETVMVAQTQLQAYQSFALFLILLVLIGVCFGIFNAWSINRDLPPE